MTVSSSSFKSKKGTMIQHPHSVVRLSLFAILLVMIVAYIFQVLRLCWTVHVVVTNSNKNQTLLHLETFVEQSRRGGGSKLDDFPPLLQPPLQADVETKEEEESSREKEEAVREVMDKQENPNQLLNGEEKDDIPQARLQPPPHARRESQHPQRSDEETEAKEAIETDGGSKIGEATAARNPKDKKADDDDDDDKSKEEGFSACLLVMDENHRLPEWLAYHYYMLPLRHLYVMSDPRSHTNPMDVLKKWKPFMTIQTLTDQEVGHTANAHVKGGMLRDHRRRQNKFYKACMGFFHSQLNQTWVATHDTDEFIYLDPGAHPQAMQRMAKPGSILTFIKDSMGENGPVEGIELKKNRSCISVLRTYVGSREESPELVQKDVPQGFNGTHFETLRFLHRGSHTRSGNVHGPPKSLVRVSTIDLTLRTHGVHELFPECQPGGLSPPLRIRHYVGSWQAFSSRVDARVGFKRSRESWEYYSEIGQGKPVDDVVRGWLQGFVKQVGHDTALHLLQGAGQLPKPSAELAKVNWNMKPDYLQSLLKGTSPFSKWLRQRYSTETLSNKTIVVRRKDPILLQT